MAMGNDKWTPTETPTKVRLVDVKDDLTGEGREGQYGNYYITKVVAGDDPSIRTWFLNARGGEHTLLHSALMAAGGACPADLIVQKTDTGKRSQRGARITQLSVTPSAAPSGGQPSLPVPTGGAAPSPTGGATIARLLPSRSSDGVMTEMLSAAHEAVLCAFGKPSTVAGKAAYIASATELARTAVSAWFQAGAPETPGEKATRLGESFEEEPERDSDPSPPEDDEQAPF